MYNRYLWTVAKSVLATMIFVAAFNLVVDPYDLIGNRIENVNRIKPATGRQLVRAKLAQLPRVHPNTVLVGNSRVDVGFDPSSEKWPASWLPVYNFGLPGVSPVGLEAVLAQALEHWQPDRVVLGLDFLDFLIDVRSPLKVSADKTNAVQKFTELTLSLDALIDSVATILAQRSRFSPNRLFDGFNPLREYDALVAIEGHRALFDQRERESLPIYASRDRMLGVMSENLQAQALARILKSLQLRGIDIVLFVHPYHARILEGLRQTERWHEMGTWRRHLTQLADRFDIPLIDYALYETPTQENVPAIGDTQPMKFYWEAGHYKSALGELLIDGLNGGTVGLGMRINSGEIDEMVRLFEERGRIYATSHPEVVKEISDRLE